MEKKVGDSISAKNASWTFGGSVPVNFEKHAEKSIPFYHEGHDLILKLSDFFLTNNSLCYDIGCSSGILTRKLSQRHEGKLTKTIGLDVEVDMISYARENSKSIPNVTFICEDVADFELEKADMIVAYYSLQFCRPKTRQYIFNKIFESLNWGGALILFEKVRGADGRFQDLMSAVYTDFKIDNGYTPENIINKANSLKGVLDPFSSQGNIDLMKRAGFIDIMTIMKYVSFEGFLAIK